MPTFRPTTTAAAALAFTLAHLAVAPLAAQEAAPAPPPAAVPDQDLPQPLSAEDTSDLLNHSPFVRSLDLEDSLELTGVAYVEGQPVVTLYDRETRQSIVVSEQPNAHGWSLKGVNTGTNLQGTQATLMIGQEVVHLTYGDAQLTPGSGKKGQPTAYVAKTDTSGSGGGPPSMPRLGADGSPKVRTSSYLGQNGREMYASLSDQARDKFKSMVRERFEKRPDLTQEQREAYAQKLFSSIKAADQKAGNTGSSGNGNNRTANAASGADRKAARRNR